MTVEWSVYADRCMQKIFAYHKAVAGVRIAHKLVRKIVKHANILAENPQAGPREELLKDMPREFRYLVVGNYKILYVIVSEKVVISSVFDCRQHPGEMRKEQQ